MCKLEQDMIRTAEIMLSPFSISSLDRRQLVSPESCNDNMLSYGVRNSIAAYLSFSDSQQPAQTTTESRKMKSKSLYAVPQSGLANADYDDDF